MKDSLADRVSQIGMLLITGMFIFGCQGREFQTPSTSASTQSAASSVPSLSPSPTPVPTPTSTPTSSPTASFVAPALVNPVNPVISFGAKCDGATDDTAAFQQAVNASDVLVPAGQTCVINGQINITTSNRHIQCGSGTMLKQTLIGPSMFFYYSPSGGRLSGDSIVGCYFLGTNSVAPQADWTDSAKHWNSPVVTQDRVDNFFLAGNTFDRFWGQAMFQTYGTVDGGTGTQVIYNTFKSCAYYGVAFDAHTKGYIGHNTLIDCAAGVENDNISQNSGGNVLEDNTLSCVYGYGAPDMGACAYISGGVAANADYSTNIVRNNSVSGVSSSAGFQGIRPSMVIIGAAWGEKPAQYSNNGCTNGCTAEH